MRKLILLLFVITSTITSSLSLAQSDLDQFYREKYTAISEINEHYEQPEELARTVSWWPSAVPATAAKSVFYRGYGSSADSFEIAVWREQNDTWVNIVPLTGSPFICDTSFSISQRSTQCNDIKTESQNGTTQCGDVRTSSFYKMTIRLYVENPPDMSQFFILLFDGSEHLYSLRVPVVNATSGDYNYHLPFYDLSLNHWSGLALQNFFGRQADIRLFTYDNNGNLISQENVQLPSHGQGAFNLTSTTNSGWVKIASNCQLAGLAFIGGTTPSTIYDIDVKDESDLTDMFTTPHVAANDDWESTMMICNPSEVSTSIRFVYISTDGVTLAAPRTITIPRFGSAQVNLQDLFGKPLSGGAITFVSDPAWVTAFMLYDGTGNGTNNWKAGLSTVPLR